MNGEREAWFDEDAGPLVRAFAVVGGRTETDPYGLDLITLVVALCTEGDLDDPEPEYARIIRVCQQPMSVAEVSSILNFPLSAVKLMLGDLITDGLLIFRSAAIPTSPEPELMHAVLDGLRRM